ncbi:hypothetical protein BCF74_12515 [Knoellia remsis]|uniref:Uncharacterized protein n=1 Tax=Knoellia remsis TaxID=407159 RepID=A0A2T0U860_9MICO|nr:hypothetical protein [Knoellia remsis]PRY54106.1 hypothetical protein BCF74_12515 [Knoellia remsis]
MTHPTPDPTPRDEVLPGPTEDSARRLRRIAGVGLAALAIVAGGATAAYAATQTDTETGWATVVDTESATPGVSDSSTTTDDSTTEGTSPGSPSFSSQERSGGRADCPDKAGSGSGESTQPGDSGQAGPSQDGSPQDEAPSPAPDTETL